ncbi:hypothetical protein BJP25_08760 [Actinokineospora bangkokensis]|uniref:Cytochrome n=1 Tax=Actinokineospora bangkokensis TaxID=1193682 RepID=A0A1Q9LSX9_9PSEU|nr:hypothetical protein BJP25_08760 [Actinokineospora bangkokensis]
MYRLELVNGVRAWAVAGYAHARAALADPRLSKSAAGLTRIMGRQLRALGVDPELSGMYSPHMLFSDGAEHGRLRRLVGAGFTRARVEALRPRAQELTARLVDGLPEDEAVDLVDEVAFPLPLNIICELMGVPAADHGLLRGWTADLMDDDHARNIPASHRMREYFSELFVRRRADPGDDLLSALLSPGAAERLTPEELMGTVFLLFVAGHETTTNLIGNAVRWLVADRERWRALGEDPSYIPAALEEVLRFDCPVRMSTHRFTAEPVTYGRVTIPADEVVMVWIHAANRDAARYADAGGFDPERPDLGTHLGFGHGPHYCLGAPLGRMEAFTALAHLTRHYPDARLATPAADLPGQRSAIMNGFTHLPVVLGPRRG